MLKQVLFVVVMLLLLAGCGDGGQSGTGERSIALADGSTLAAADMDGRWLFVNYWAEWCAPCLVEIPELNEFHEDHEQVLVLGVNFDRLPPEELLPQMEQLDIRFPVAAAEPADVLDIAPPEVLPSTYVFNPEGERVGVLIGPQSLDDLAAVLETGAADRP